LKKRKIKKIATKRVEGCYLYNHYIDILKSKYGKKAKTRLILELKGRKQSAKKTKIFQILTFTIRCSEDRMYRMFPNGL
jgi:hypothetical protein